MSTRCNIHFNYGRDVVANIYRHSDGYPGEVVNGDEVKYGVLSDLLTFFRKLVAEVPDNRLSDPEYLASKFLVWQSQELTEYSRIRFPAKGPKDEDGYGPKHYLQFLGVSPCLRDHGDIEYIYEVDCTKFDEEGLPMVRWKTAAKGARFKTVKLGAPKAA